MLLSWMPSMRLGSRKRSFLALSVAALAAGALALLAAMSFGAAGALAAEEKCALPGSEFQGADGNQNTPSLLEQVECEGLGRPTTRDWQSDVLAKKAITSEDPQASDSELTGKENVPNLWKLGAHAAGVKPPKDNIITAWSEVEPQAASTFLYLAFQREGSVGTTFLTFELNQVKGEWENEAGSMIPCRTTGDVLISYEVSGGSIGEVVVQEWTSTATKTVTIGGKSVACGTEGELKGGAVKVEPSAGVQGAMNAKAIENFLPDEANGTPATIEENNFGEAALNLVKVLKEAQINPCFDFGQIWMHTRSSLSVTSELHDYIAPVPLLVQSCSISGRKFDDANANKKHDPGEAYLEGWKIQLLNATTKAVVQETTTDSEGNYTFTKVEEGTYIVQEVGQTGWTCDVPGEGKACQYEVTIDSEHLNVTEREFGNVPTSKVVTTQEPKSGAVGSTFGDSATVSGPTGTPTPTGEVEFTLYSEEGCKGAVAGPFKETLSEGKAAIPNASKVALTKSGTYYWVATYGGDEFNAEASSGCNDEPVTVEKAKPSIATTPSGSVTVGEKVKDSATLKGLVEATGAGKVTFKLYSDAKCETEVAHFESTGIGGTGEVTVNSGEYTTTKAGTYYWVATYPGDANNEPAATKCGDETVVVNPAEPRITTKAVTPVTVGAKIHDTATLSGLVNPDGTGKVTFKLYSDSGCATKVFESTNPTSGGIGANGNVESGEYTTTAAGTYFWVASYSGDSNNVSVSTSCKDAEESSVVEKTKPGISTKATPEVVVGENIKDTATLTGLVNATSGTVTFKLFSDSSCSTEVTAAKSTSAAVVGSGTIDVPSGEYKTTTAGTYFWIASYSGDSNNGPVTSGCKDTNESTVVNKAQPGISTKAVTPVTVGAKVHDTATLSGLVNPDGTGTVTFRLFAESSCDSTPVFESTSAGIGANGDVSSGEYTTVAAGTYYWVASYSGDSNNKPVVSGCKAEGETSVVEKAKPAISTTASGSVVYGGSLHDTAHLSGGSVNIAGKIVFKLYAASDTTCATVLKTVETEVGKGNGDYESPSVTVGVGSYQWIAEYSGDQNNVAASTSCNDPNEQASVTEHPGIAVVKEQQIAGSGQPFTTAPLEAKVGQQINYRITVTNTGDVALALSFSDPHCDAGTITGPTGNLNPDGTLPAGGVAQYFCSHVMQSGDAPQLTNAATITGQPPSGPPVSATASVVVNVAKAVVEAKCTLVLSSIVLHGAGGSRRKPFTVSISSLGIEQITFYLDKHKIKTLTQKQAKHGKYTIKIDPRKLRYGAHTVSIKTVMTDRACAALARSGVFVHPRPPVVKPKFTG